MTTTICDSSAVDNYLRELSNREAERTRRLNIENYKREVPFTILKYIGIAIAITLVLWALGRSIGNSNSFIQKVIHSGFGELTGTNTDKIVTSTLKLLIDNQYYKMKISGRNPFGTGDACDQIISILNLTNKNEKGITN